jgi:hypothetical protein
LPWRALLLWSSMDDMVWASAVREDAVRSGTWRRLSVGRPWAICQEGRTVSGVEGWAVSPGWVTTVRSARSGGMPPETARRESSVVTPWAAACWKRRVYAVRRAAVTEPVAEEGEDGRGVLVDEGGERGDGECGGLAVDQRGGRDAGAGQLVAGEIVQALNIREERGGRGWERGLCGVGVEEGAVDLVGVEGDGKGGLDGRGGAGDGKAGSETASTERFWDWAQAVAAASWSAVAP